MSGCINTDRDYRGCVYIPRADGHHSHGENGQFSVVELPAFKVNANQKHSKVEVFVEDPTGQTIKPYVKVVGDLYTSTFLPKMTGDYLVSMCVDGENIEGSPFYVKVFDPKLIRVLGLRGGIVSQLNGFSVNTDGIGEGPMAITITHLGSNRIVPARIMQDPGRKSLFHVEWMPEEAGFYRVNVQFARVDADGSPYTIEVINPSLSTISGLSSGQLISAGQLNKFIIRVPSKMVVMNEMRVDVTDPIGVRVPARLIDNNDGTVAVEFLPIIVGSHVITASYFNMAISGSPFKVTSFDPTKVKIINWKPVGNVSKSVDFDVDISKAGPGDLDINISGGEAPYQIHEREHGIYRVTFTPKQPGTLKFGFTFNRVKISGGPWTCVVASAPTAAAFGNGVQPSPSLLINTPTSFEVKVQGSNEDAHVDVVVKGPNGAVINADKMGSINNVHKYQYTPTSIGCYSIEIKLDGVPISGSPFTSRVYSPGSVILGEVKRGFVGREVEFSVDASQAGDGSVEVVVDGGSVPCNVVQTVARGVYSVTFMPKEAKVYNATVKFNGETVKGSPVSVNVLDLSKVTLVGGSSDLKVAVNKVYTLKLNTAGSGNGQFTAIVRAPSGAEITPLIREVNKKFLEIEYTPKEIGVYCVEVELEGMALAVNPIQFSTYNSSKIKVRDIKDGIVGKVMKITVESGDPGEGDLKFSVLGPNGGLLNNSVEQINSSNYSVIFTPLIQGQHQFTMSFNEEPVIGSPFTFQVYNVNNIAATGQTLRSFACNKMATFFITSPHVIRSTDCDVKITDPSLKNVPARLSDMNDGTVRCDFTGAAPGDYKIDVKCWGHSIPDSPFLSKASDVTKVTVTPILSALVGLNSSFNINVKDAGEGTLEISIQNPNGQQIPNSVAPMGPGQFVVTFMPAVQGTHHANVTFNEEPVKGSPFSIQVNDPTKCQVKGEGLEMVRCNKATNFVITSSGATINNVNVKIIGPKNLDVRSRISEQGPGVFKVEYTPLVPGDYVIDVEIFGKEVPNGPFTAKCWDHTKVKCTKIASGRVGVQTSFNLDASGAGEGDMEIVISGPSRQNIANHVTPLGPGLFVVTFTPEEGGVHKVSVTFNQENVTGSPFIFNVIDLGRASARGDGLGAVKVNANASFLITAPGAMEKDLELLIMAPNGKEVTHKMTEVGNNVFKVDYTPTMAGDHRVEVNYFGLALPGCPYYPKVWDSSKVLVTNVKNGRVGNVNVFNLDVTDAGEGTLEIGVTSPSGQNIHNNVMPSGAGKFEVSCVPLEPGMYKISVTFNRENVVGSPYSFLATDMNKVLARGDGLGGGRCGVATSFVVTAPAAQQKDVDIIVVGPDNTELLTRISETTPGNFKCEYTPQMAGTYQIKVNYFGHSIPSSPFLVKVWDTSKASIICPPTCKVGMLSNIIINTKDAGEGTLEISIATPSNRPLQCNVSSFAGGRYEASFVATETGVHKVSATFNNEHISGCPVSINVIDPSKVTFNKGENNSLVPCNQPTSFHFRAPAASGRDVHVKVTGPDYKDIVPRVIENHDQYTVEFTPLKIGDHVIEVTYFGEMISCCPFVCKAYNASLVQLTPVGNGAVNKASHFTVNTGQAGVGVLDVVVTADGLAVPCAVKNMSSCLYDVSFTPQVCHSHDVCVKFNGEEVPGSPLHVLVIDGSKATAAGLGLELAKVNAVASFDVITNNPPNINAKLEAHITNAKGQFLPCKVTSTGPTSYHVEYVPKDAGCHKIALTYAGSFIQGSPYSVDVFDPSAIRISCCSYGVVGKQYCFEVDTTKCGCLTGHLDVEVKGHLTKPITQVTSSRGVYTVNFVASENVSHNVAVTYLGENCSGSPFSVKFIDPKNMHVNWDSVCRMPVNRAVTFDLVLGEVNMASLINVPGNELMSAICRVRDPNGRELATRIDRQTECFRIEFHPTMIGPHTIDLKFGGTTIVGSPHTCNVYNAAKVAITDANIDNQLGRESYFTVDSSRAGDGNVEVKVICGEAEVITRAAPIGDRIVKYSFMPVQPKPHVATVKFCSEPVQGSPLTFQVINPANKMTLSRTTPDKIGPLGQPITALLLSDGFMLNSADIKAEARGASSELLVTTLTSELDGTNKITFTPNCTGPAKLDVSYCGKAVSGSPLIYDIFDACKVVAEIQNSGVVDQPVSFDVVLSKAGSAPLDIKITNGRNVSLPMTNQIVSYGQRVTYIPKEAGLHVICIQYGCVDVPGSPFHQQIIDSFMPTAHGEGLENAIENSPATFTLDTRGHYGNLKVDVQGPHTLAVTRMEETENGSTKVTYTPIEIGTYKVFVKWNDKDIYGSPFQVHVTSPKKVQVVGGWESILDHHHHHMPLVVNEKKMFELDCSKAGPGNLRVNVTGPDGVMPTEVHERADRRYHVGFTPRVEGNYTMKMYYNEQPLERFPVLGTAVRLLINQKAPPPCPVHHHHHQSHSHVHEHEHPIKLAAVAHGQGLTSAKMLEEAEFFVVVPDEKDTVAATMIGVEDEIPIQVIRTDGNYNLFRCTYKPKRQGNYLINLTCNGHPIANSPFKVKVEPLVEIPERPIIAMGYGIAVAEVNREAEFLLDGVDSDEQPKVVLSGPAGEIPVYLTRFSPERYRCCYTPNRPGSYVLSVTNKNKHIPGSPFNVLVSGWDGVRNLPPTAKNLQCGANGLVYNFNGVPYNVKYPNEICNPNPFLVVAMGPGLSRAVKNQPAEFIVDTSASGPGDVTIQLTGPKEDVPVKIYQSADNIYQCQYVPLEEGPHLLNITYGGLNISNSPYHISVISDQKALNVKDVVVVGRGLCEGLVNEPAEFIIDATQAGPGKPEVKITEHKSEIPCKISQVVTGIYKCTYVPPKEGEYHVFVLYGEVLVPGAPYEVMVKNPPKEKPDKFMVVTGPGMSLAVVGQRAEFLLDGFEYDNLNMRLSCQNGMDLPLQLFKIEPNKYICAYTPTMPGPHTLSILTGKQHIPGSPFTVNVVEEMNLLPFPRPFNLKVKYENSDDDEEEEEEEDKDGGFLGRFFNGGKKTKRMKKKKVVDARIVTTNLDPLQHFADYSIHHRHCDQPVVVIGPGKTEAVVNKMAEFIIDGAAGEPTIHLTGVEGDIDVQCSKLTSCRYHCSYIPQKEGVYLLNIATGGLNVPGCPFKVQVTNGSDPSLLVVVPECPDGKNMIAVGPGLGTAYEKKTAEFIIDGTDCEELPKITLTGTGGDVMVQCNRMNDHLFKCSYVPEKTGVYLMNIQIKGVNIPGSPFKVTVLPEDVPKPPSCAAVAVGEGLIFGSKNKRAEFVIDGVVAGEPMILCQGPAGPMQVSCAKQSDTRYVCYFYPKDAGTYIIHISVGGTPVCGSPFNVTVTDEDLEGPCYPEKVLVIGPGVSFAVPGVTSEFIIDASAAGKGVPAVELMGPNGLVPTQVIRLFDNIYRCIYTTTVRGTHTLSVAFNGKHIPGSPFKFECMGQNVAVAGIGDASKVVAIGPGLSGAQVNGLAEFLIDGCQDFTPMVQMYGSAMDVPVQCVKIADGRFKCSYIPQASGVHILIISVCGSQIPGSPFKVNVAENGPEVLLLQKPFATGQGLSVAQVGQRAEFMMEGVFNCKEPVVTMAGTAGDVIVQCQKVDEGTYKCTYIPHACGVYLMTVSCGDCQIIGSPFKVTVGCDEPPPQPCPVKTAVAIGPGLSDANVGKTAEFLIDGACDSPEIKMIGLTGDLAVQSSIIGEDRYKCSYTPTAPGVYLLSISCCGFQLPGSPFKVVVPPTVEEFHPSRSCVAIGPGLSQGCLDKISEFIIDGAGAAENLQVQMVGRSGNEVLIRSLNMGNGRYLCSYMPHIPGEYQLSVKSNNNHISGSPFRVLVTSEQDNFPARSPDPVFPPRNPPVPPPSVVIVSPETKEILNPEILRPVCAIALGPGLTNATLHQVAEFLIDGCFDDEPQVLLAGVADNIPVHALKIGEGRFKCAYTPEKPGVYLLSIACNGSQVIGSPFKIVVEDVKPPKVDREMVVVSGLGTSCGSTSKVSEFSIDGAVSVHKGRCFLARFIAKRTVKIYYKRPEPIVKLFGASGEVNVTTSRNGTSLYKCSYIPPSPGVYLLSISYQGLQVPGSPFKVLVGSDDGRPCFDSDGKSCPDTCKPVAIGPGLTCAEMNSVAEFMLDGAGPTEPQIVMIGVNGEVPVKYVKLAEGRYKCAYVPQAPGVYLLSITCHGNQIPGSPFKVTVHGAPVFIERPQPIPIGVVQQPQLILQQPQHPQLILQQQPQVIVRQQPVAMGQGLYLGQANQMTEFLIDSCPDVPEIQMHGCDCEVFVRCFRVDDCRYKCSYVAQKPGIYMLSLSIKGVQIPGSPFKVVIQPDSNNPNIHQLPPLIVPAQIVNTPIVVPMQAGRVFAKPPKNDDGGSDDEDDKNIAMKPTTFSSAVASGSGLMGAQLNDLAEFVVDGSRDEPIAHMHGVDEEVAVRFHEVCDGRWKGSYLVSKPGAYSLTLIANDLQVKGCPFKITVHPPVKATNADVYYKKKKKQTVEKTVQRTTPESVATTYTEFMSIVAEPEDSAPLPPREKIKPCVAQNAIALGGGLTQAYCGKAAEFMVDCSNAGHGFLKAQLVGITNAVDVHCTDIGEKRYVCSYIPKVQGAYLLNVTWSDQPIPGSPFKVAVMSSVDPSKVTFSGDVFTNGGIVGQPINVMVDAKNAGKDELKATCKGPNKFTQCKVEEVAEGLFNVSFTPEEPGPHLLHFQYAGVMIPNCPATIRIAGPIDPSKVVVTGKGVQDGVLATFDNSFTVETKGAGPGQLTVRMRGRRDTFRIEMRRDPMNNRTIHCRYNPTEVGLYILDIKWSGQHVPGSPFKIHLFDSMMELNQFKRTGAIEGFAANRISELGKNDSIRSNGFDNEFD